MNKADSISAIYEAIATEGFTERTAGMISNLVNDIEDGKTDIEGFNQQEHAGLCKAGEALIGARIVAGYAAESLAASSNAAAGQGKPASWQVESCQCIYR